ncbi:uncharacterized protein TNCT_177441 [Trichonephila clavata]|uniref:Uncharacterized protein n=1 Tax=Trichonephila clavata TaxID=2740835 RepID=A0A8X6KZ29_TRICU|nr:uncharacterized protein TNCT_177441 [Trichonephila clavata]
MSQAENVNTDFLPIIYDIIRSIEKETYETTPKQHENADTNLKIPELRTKLQQCREQIQKLPVYDKNFEYFRNKTEYKNSVVNLDNNLLESKIGGPGYSFVIKEHDIQLEEHFKHLTHRENVMKLSAIEVKDLLFLMANIRIDTSKYATILKHLDEKCAISVERWSLDLAFYVLDAWFIIWGSKVFKKHYYSAITSLWGRRMKKCSKFNLILMLYFIGLSKNSPPFLMESIEERMEAYAPYFSDEEWAVACLSFFKTSTQMNSNLLLKRAFQALENLILKNDRFNVISILKCFRLSKYYDERLWEILKRYTLNESNTFTFVECTNFLATFATQNKYEKELFSCLEARGLQTLQNEINSLSEDEYKNIKTHPSLKSRVKDIARLLWALTSMGHNIKEETVDFLTDTIRQRWKMGEFDKQVHILIDYLQSLSLIGHYPHDILSYVLQASTLKKILYLNRSKPKYQLYFLQRSTQIEAPNVEIYMKNMFNPIPKSLDKDIKERKGFQTFIDILNKTSIQNYKCCYFMPHIMISGIIVECNKSELSEDDLAKNFTMLQKYLREGIISSQMKDFLKNNRDYICLEIIDSSVCVNSSTEPIGLMRTKIRQLKTLNMKVIALTTDEINKLASKDVSKDCEDINDIIKLL